MKSAMSSKEYNELMFELCFTRAMMFALFASFVYRDYGLCPAFACTLLPTIASAIYMIVYMRRANDRTDREEDGGQH